MTIALAGSNTFLLSRRLEELVDAFKAEHGDLALERIDGSETEISAILEATASLPFLASKKMVVIRNLGLNKAAAEAIEQIIDSAGESTELILYEPITDKRSLYYKTLKSKTQLEEYADLDSLALSKWLVDEAKKKGASLAPAEASYLVDRLGTNQAILASELEKLALYDRQILRSNIELLTEKTPQSRVFDLLEAAFAGHTKKALSLYEEQRAQKVEPQAILALLIWQLHLIAIAKAARGRSMNEVAAEAKLSPYPLNKAASLARRLTDDQLRLLISELAQIDSKSRTVYLDLNEALKTFITTL